MPVKNTIYRDPTTVNDASPTDEPGQCSRYYHPTYGWWVVRYVKHLDAVTYAAGQVVQFVATDRSTVTNDVSGGSTPIGAAGIALNVVTQNYWSYILAQGYYPTVKTNGDDDIAAKDQIIVGAADGACDSATTMTGNHLGFARAADVDADNTVAAEIDCSVE